ncbi:AAEL013180-PA [Aedes aegypti]|uniref:AAEL013180-PA n=1 Tax=Aedes aegypti TaxID=7159 RepID=Q16JX5_AEDAE|nr:AAEL013180-PA [Aedes aegypti]
MGIFNYIYSDINSITFFSVFLLRDTRTRLTILFVRVCSHFQVTHFSSFQFVWFLIMPSRSLATLPIDFYILIPLRRRSVREASQRNYSLFFVHFSLVSSCPSGHQRSYLSLSPPIMFVSMSFLSRFMNCITGTIQHCYIFALAILLQCFFSFPRCVCICMCVLHVSVPSSCVVFVFGIKVVLWDDGGIDEETFIRRVVVQQMVGTLECRVTDED